MNELAGQASKWKFGQDDTIRWMSNRLGEQTGILIADEVGMGKTRVAMVAIRSVLEAGGSVAVVVPPGLIYQWKKEWEEFLKSIGNKEQDTKSSNEPIMLRSYYSLFEDNNLQFPLTQNAGRWLLISHQFGPPLLRNDARPRRYMLPVLVKALIDVNNGKHKSNSYWQLVKKLYKGNEECIGGAYCPSNNKENKATDCPVKIENVDCNELPQINKAANYLMELVENKKSLFDDFATDDLPFRSLESAKAKEDFKKYFNDEKRGLKMIKKLLGSIDLLIIDEAHKNRDVEDDPKRLGTILRDIIEADNSKRIALTATPMELNACQWEEVFKRIGAKYPKDSVDNFAKAHTEANKHPDNVAIIERLIAASNDFVKKLKPYVTRRMRTEQKEMRELIGEELCKEKAHPHRDYEKKINIDYCEIEDEWKPSVFALEAIGKAAKGCITDDKDLNKQLGRLKIADSRYAAGKISTSGADSTNKETDGNGKDESNDQQKLDEAINKYFENNRLDKRDDNNEYNRQSYIQGKLRRIQYWNRILKSNNADLAGHPRIRKTADEIEKYLWDNGQLKQEKVLVFGTFLEPLKSLWDVLNRRTVLRLLDRKKSNDEHEPPIPGATMCIDNLAGIWAEYRRMEPRPSRKYSSEDELKSAIEKGGKSYEDLRDKLTTHIDKKFVATLPGDVAIKNIENAEDDVVKLLRARLVNDIIYNDTEFEQYQKKNIKMKALDIWCEYLKSFFDKRDDEREPDRKGQPKSTWAKHDYFTGDEEKIKELIQLDNFADNVSEEALKKLLKDELDHLSGRFGMFARMLYGNVKMETRRVLQAQFNDKNSFPKVIIAQSQVGREGLNLHKACRIVVQFHSEWNPGIIEQQIGRVDRIDSLWEAEAKEWKDKGKQGEMPKITVIPVIFKGTYDSFQYGVSKKRRENLKAHLFGELLNDEALDKLANDDTLREKLRKAAPSFAPE